MLSQQQSGPQRGEPLAEGVAKDFSLIIDEADSALGLSEVMVPVPQGGNQSWRLLLITLLILQARLWVGEGSLAETAALLERIEAQEARNELLRERNRALELDVRELKSGTDGIEERARGELGMIKDGETYFLYIPAQGPTSP